MPLNASCAQLEQSCSGSLQSALTPVRDSFNKSFRPEILDPPAGSSVDLLLSDPDSTLVSTGFVRSCLMRARETSVCTCLHLSGFVFAAVCACMYVCTVLCLAVCVCACVFLSVYRQYCLRWCATACRCLSLLATLHVRRYLCVPVCCCLRLSKFLRMLQ